MSCNKKKLNIGNNKVNAKRNICKSFVKMSDKFSLFINPPEEIVVKAKLTESRSLRSIELYTSITKIVVKKYIRKILIKL